MTRFKLAMFDMDGTLLNARTIFVFAEKKGFQDELTRLIKTQDLEFYEKSIEIAKSLKGMEKKELLEIFGNIPLHEHVESVISELNNKGIKTAIATDSYQFVADDLKERLGMDYAFANNLIMDDGIVTGELEIHNRELKEDFDNSKIYSICKSCVLEDLCRDLNISADETVAVGDGKVDIGMLNKAGLGIAFNAPDEVQKHADIVVNNLREVLGHI
jgi:phosphoserine phosphatase